MTDSESEKLRETSAEYFTRVIEGEPERTIEAVLARFILPTPGREEIAKAIANELRNTRTPSQYREALEEYDRLGNQLYEAVCALIPALTHIPEKVRAVNEAMYQWEHRAALSSPQDDGWVRVDEANPLPDDLSPKDWVKVHAILFGHCLSQMEPKWRTCVVAYRRYSPHPIEDRQEK